MDDLKNYFEKLNLEAKKQNVQLEMLITGKEVLSLGFQKKKLEKYEANSIKVAGLRVIDGASQGYSFTENLSWEALHRAYQDAYQNAQTLKGDSKQEKLALARPAKLQDFPNLENKKEIPIEAKMEIAKQLEETTLKADSRIESVPYSALKESTDFRRILNSEGVDLSFSAKAYVGYAYGLAKSGAVTKMGGESFFVRNFEEISVEELARSTAEKATSRLGAQKLPTGKYPAIIDREEMATFITMLFNHLSAKEVVDGVSLLTGKLEQKIASSLFYLADDPFEMRGSAVRPFDSEGTPSQKTSVFEAGVFKSYLTNLETSHQLGIRNTGNASRGPSTSLNVSPSNLVMAQGQTSREEMLSRPGKVVLITEINGGLHSGYKESTGDFSLPCEGFLYEDGKLLMPVDQFVVSGNIFELIQDIVAVGNQYNKPGNTNICPDVMIKALSFAG